MRSAAWWLLGFVLLLLACSFGVSAVIALGNGDLGMATLQTLCTIVLTCAGHRAWGVRLATVRTD